MTQTVESVSALVQRIHIMQAEQPPGQRLIIAIAGAPGSGKSTLAADLCQRLNSSHDAGESVGVSTPENDPAAAQDPRHGKADLPARGVRVPNSHVTDTIGSVAGVTSAIVVPMDGFHLDNAVLIERDQMAVKGAPQTYDVAGFVALVQRLSEPGGGEVCIPVFDRAADLSRNAAQCVDENHRVILVEGNYLLLDRPGWKSLAPLFHLRVLLDVPVETLEQRLIQRWLDHGMAPDAARQRALANDIPNAHVVMQESTGAHLFFKSVRQ